MVAASVLMPRHKALTAAAPQSPRCCLCRSGLLTSLAAWCHQLQAHRRALRPSPLASPLALRLVSPLLVSLRPAQMACCRPSASHRPRLVSETVCRTCARVAAHAVRAVTLPPLICPVPRAASPSRLSCRCHRARRHPSPPAPRRSTWPATAGPWHRATHCQAWNRSTLAGFPGCAAFARPSWRPDCSGWPLAQHSGSSSRWRPQQQSLVGLGHQQAAVLVRPPLAGGVREAVRGGGARPRQVFCECSGF
jgi:hypothetical protein